MKKTRCPKCHHPNIRVVYQDEMEFIQCPRCKYDETLFDTVLDTVENERTSAKSRSPYKAGGSKRTQK